MVRRYKDAIRSGADRGGRSCGDWNALNTNDTTWKMLDAQYRAAEKRKDVKAQKSLLAKMVDINKRSLELNAQLPQLEEIIAQGRMQRWIIGNT